MAGQELIVADQEWADAARKQVDGALALLVRNGLVIDKWPPKDIPAGGWTPETIAALDPEVRWQGVAFSFYTSLVAGDIAGLLHEYDEDRLLEGMEE